ncbi:hypothetical protein KXS00_10065 [Olivibacter jilunii]
MLIDIKGRVWNKFLDLLSQGTISMHPDYSAGKKWTEVRLLTGYIVARAERVRIVKYPDIGKCTVSLSTK